MSFNQSNLIQYPEYKKLSVCVTFHYVADRLKYLAEVCEGLINIAPEVYLTIITNTSQEDEVYKIKHIVNPEKLRFELLTPSGLGHPYLLAWSHLPVFKRQFADKSFTHFLYLEDDIKITKENVGYWLKNRSLLKPFGFYPSFFRRELNSKDNNWYSTDVMEKMSLYDCPSIDIEDKSFIGILYSYQGMYLLDRELMQEHLEGPSSSPDCEHNNTGIFRMHSPQIREKAALCLTYMNIPRGFRARNLLPFDKEKLQVKSYSMIDHLPANYSNNPSHTIGKIKIDEIFIRKSINTYFRKKFKLFAKSMIEYFLK